MATVTFGREADPSQDCYLHVQCPWRLEGPRGIVTGRSDLWQPADPEEPGWWEKKYEEYRTLRDSRLEEFHREIEAIPAGLRLLSLRAGSSGDLDLHFSGDWRILVFPDSSRSECWRFFRKSGEHFVVPREE